MALVVGACRLKIPSNRCKGRWSAPLLTMTCAISPGAAKAPGIASAGLGATTTFCSAGVKPLAGSKPARIRTRQGDTPVISIVAVPAAVSTEAAWAREPSSPTTWTGRNSKADAFVPVGPATASPSHRSLFHEKPMAAAQMVFADQGQDALITPCRRKALEQNKRLGLSGYCSHRAGVRFGLQGVF